MYTMVAWAPPPGGSRSFGELPEHLQCRILLASTTHEGGRLLSHVGRCARVCTTWWRLVRESAAYGAGIHGPHHTAAAVRGWYHPRRHDDPQLAMPARERVLRGILRSLMDSRPGGRYEGKLLLNAISNSDIGDAGSCALGAALHAMPGPLALTKINLYACATTASGIAPVADAFCNRGFKAPGLQDLVLNANIHLRDDGLAILAQALPSTLINFSMASTGCGNKGMSAVAAALGRISSLETLDCGGNSGIGALGWGALAAALPQMFALWSLYAGACEMDDSGVAALASGLPHAQALKSLYLGHNNIANAGARSLTEVLPRCLLLAHLELFGNRYDAREMAALDAVGGPRLQLVHDDPDDSS